MISEAASDTMIDGREREPEARSFALEVTRTDTATRSGTG